MAIQEDLQSAVKKIFTDTWQVRKGQDVPESEDVALGNDGVKLDATVLYADISGSTRMVDAGNAEFCGEVYKAYLHCAAKLISFHGGEITAYDGDRIMGVFIGESKNSQAVRCGLGINWAVIHVIRPSLGAQYPEKDFQLRQVVGIDTSELLVARTGVRGANDLVWVGRAANYAAKLTELNAGYSTWISHSVFEKMNSSLKHSQDGRQMWEVRRWTAMRDFSIYRSNWWRVPA
jgi:class 3 adenylate cyclase